MAVGIPEQLQGMPKLVMVVLELALKWRFLSVRFICST